MGLSSPKTIVIAGLSLLAMAWSIHRILTAGVPPPPDQIMVDVWRCQHEGKEVVFTPLQMNAAFDEGRFEQNGGSIYYECPDCGKMSLVHDQGASTSRTLEARGMSGRETP